LAYAESALYAHYVTVRLDSRRWAAPADPFQHSDDAGRYVAAASRAVQEVRGRTRHRSRPGCLPDKPGGVRRW
jgi:hypothetical protein